ncbi:MAG: hypothetical protein ACI88A_000792 [Paraglaciecola sp.]|jgi:hypothetical protein
MRVIFLPIVVSENQYLSRNEHLTNLVIGNVPRCLGTSIHRTQSIHGSSDKGSSADSLVIVTHLF